ncbi:MAG TPA: hypothetical protein VD713_03615 [Sphingomonadales bacterium]|nr:hypothetical protein [Sphingomonadales bacterium]
MSNLIGELKRRNVFKVGLAYVIVGWVVLQFIDVSAQILDLPKWFGKALYVLLIAGFPVSLVLAWAYEITPQGLKKTKEVDRKKSIAPKTGQKLNYVIIAGLALALGYFLWERQWGGPVNEVAGAREASIAVLPFADLSPGRDQEYFADGISEEILNVLAKIPTMKVAGRTSSFQFKGKNEDLRAIGQQLNVAHVLEGSVRKDANRVRITVQLISADNGFHLWSETYDRELTDVFAIQDQISKAVADALQVQLGSGEGVKPETSNLEAYSLYLRARQYLHSRGADNLDKAAKLFEAVVILDPQFSSAWSGMSRAYGLLPAYLVNSPETNALYKKGKHAAERALEINAQNAEAYSGLSYINFAELDWAAADKNNTMAITLAPNDAEIANFAGDYYRFTGDRANAFKWEGRALELDPLHVVNVWDYAYTHNDFSLYEEGLLYADQALKMDPGFALSFVYQVKANLLINLKRFDEARQLIKTIEERSGNPFLILDLKAFVASGEGDRRQLRAILSEMENMVRQGTGTPGYLYLYFFALGDFDKGLEYYRRAYDILDPALVGVPGFVPENYTNDPAIIAKMELPGMKELFDLRRRNRAAGNGPLS